MLPPSQPACPPSLLHLQDSEPVTALALSPNGHLLFSASRSLQQRCWSLETGQAVRSFKVRSACA